MLGSKPLTASGEKLFGQKYLDNWPLEGDMSTCKKSLYLF